MTTLDSVPEVEALLIKGHKLTTLAALALYDDLGRGGEVTTRARQALEESLDASWRGKGLAPGSLATRPRFICLPPYFEDAGLASSVGHIWTALPHACHRHPYALPPTTGELLQLIAVTRRFAERGA